MRQLALWAFVLAVGLNAQAALVFSDIPWNTPAAAVSEKLKAAGFKQIRKDKQGDITFRGSLLGHEAGGIAVLSQGRLVRVLIMLSTPDETSREAYNEVRSILVQRYGQPSTTTVSFADPFHEGDGYEAEAIRSGKGIFLTRWTEGGEQLIVNITSGLAVAVTYESSGWPAEAERRKNKGVAGF